MRARSIFQFFALQRSMVGMLTMAILAGLGEKMAERFLPLYLMALSGGALSVGLLNGLQNFLGSIYSLAGGLCSDRFGIKRSLLWFNLAAMAGYVLIILVPSWPAVIGGAVLFLSWSMISQPASLSLVANVLPLNKRTMGVTMHSLIRRVPMALGPVLGGWFISLWGLHTGVRVAFAVALFMAAVSLIAQQILIEPDPARAAGGSPSRHPLLLFRRMPGALKQLLISDILVRFCEQIPYAFVVLWCMNVATAPVTALQFGLLTAIEMVAAVLVYIPVAYLADRSHKKPFVVMTFMFFTLFPLLLLFCQSFWPMALAFVVRGLKEFGEPTRKALILDLAPEDARAGMFGLYYLLRDVVVSVAAFGGAFLWMISPAANFLAAFAFGLAGTLWFLWKGSDLKS
jgi:MFS family permease